MFEVNNSKDTRKTSITFGAFIANFELKSHHVLVLLLLIHTRFDNEIFVLKSLSCKSRNKLQKITEILTLEQNLRKV